MKAVLAARKFGVAVAKTAEHKKLILANLMDYVASTNMVPMPDLPAKPPNVVAYEKSAKRLPAAKAPSVAPSQTSLGLTPATPQVTPAAPPPPPSTATTASPSLLAFGAGGVSSASSASASASAPTPSVPKLAGFGSQLL